MKQHLAAMLAEWLTQWPTTGGSDFERPQLALRRIATAIAQLEARVQIGCLIEDDFPPRIVWLHPTL